MLFFIQTISSGLIPCKNLTFIHVGKRHLCSPPFFNLRNALKKYIFKDEGMKLSFRK